MEPRRIIRPWLLLGTGLLLIAAVWFFRAPLREHLRNAATLSNNAPPPEVVAEMIEQSANPQAALLAAWRSGKMVHRETAIHELGLLYHPEQPLPAELEAILLTATLDPDLDVRETAFGILQTRQDPALTALAAAQLNDVDSAARRLGLQHLGSTPARVGVPLVIGLLDDPAWPVVGQTLKLLENWSGETFGAKQSDAVAVENPQSGLLETTPAGAVRLHAATERARAWWHDHQAEYPPVPLTLPTPVLGTLPVVPAVDFQLRTLAGDTVRLSDFRGKVVLVNF
jgi:hypothetical protein